MMRLWLLYGELSVGTRVSVGSGVGVSVGVLVAVGVGVSVGVSVAVGVSVGGGVFVAVGGVSDISRIITVSVMRGINDAAMAVAVPG